MTKKTLLNVIVGLICSLICSAQAPKKKKIAIYPFDDRLVAVRSQGQTGENQMIGEKLAEDLTSALADSTVFDVVDRQYLDRIVKEQNLKMDDRFDPQAAAKLGKLANVDAIVIGTVNNFSSNVEQKEEGSFVGKKRVLTAVVSLKATARLISVETGEIVAAPSATAEKTSIIGQEKSNNVGGFLTGNAAANTSSKTGLGNSQAALAKLVDDATNEVGKAVGRQIDSKGTWIQSAPVPALLIKVAGVADGEVLINKGKSSGLSAAAELVIFRSVDTGLKDPDSGKPIMRRHSVCVLTLKDVDDSSASGVCKGDQVAQAGDLAEQAKR